MPLHITHGEFVAHVDLNDPYGLPAAVSLYTATRPEGKPVTTIFTYLPSSVARKLARELDEAADAADQVNADRKTRDDQRRAALSAEAKKITP